MDRDDGNEVEAVVVTAKRHKNGREFTAFYVALYTRGSTTPRYVDDVGDVNYGAGTQITFVDETGALPQIIFKTTVPARGLRQLLRSLAVFANGYEGRLSRGQQKLIAYLNEAFSERIEKGQAIVFEERRLAKNAVMGVDMVSGPEGYLVPLVRNGNEITIAVDSDAFSGSFSEENRTVLLHELLHLSSSFQAEFNRFYGRQFSSFDLATYNSTHNSYFFDAAESLEIIIRRQPDPVAEPDPERTVIEGGPGPDRLFGNDSYGNVLTGFDGDDDLRAEGQRNLLSGSQGNDRYHLGANTGIGHISDGAGFNVLEIDAPYTLDHLRVERFGPATWIALDPENGNSTATELPNKMNIGAPEFGYTISAVLVGGQQIDLPSVIALQNSKPEFHSANYSEIANPFSGGVVGVIHAVDRDETPITLSVVGVEGWGVLRRWWIEGNYLRTDTVWRQNAFTETMVTVRASDGRNWTDDVFTVRWRPDPNSGVIEP